MRADGEVYWVNNGGEMFDFENAGDYVGFERGIPPPIETLWRFANAFGWPSPWTREFVNNIKLIELYVFPPIPGEVERPLSEKLQKEILTLPPAWG